MLNESIDTLLRLLPLPNLDVITPIMTPTNLQIHYIQKKTFDKRRNWASYCNWFRNQNLEFPTDVDHLYHKYNHLFPNTVDFKDKLLLSIELSAPYYIKRSNDDIFLDYIERNKDPSLKGIGKLILPNLVAWLSNKGFKNLIAVPINQSVRTYSSMIGFSSENKTFFINYQLFDKK